LAALIVAAGYFAIIAPDEARISDSRARTDALLEQVVADEQTVRNAAQLERVQHDITVDLQGVNLRTDRAGLVAELLRDLERIARGHHARVVSVQTETGPQAGPPFDTAFLDIGLEGRYDAVLQTMAGLSQARVLTKIMESSVDRAKGRDDELSPLLAVQLKVAVFHLQGLQPGESNAGTKST
jgi:hypothetical protein